MKEIEIDWDIHKLIEAERHGFDEPPYVALRRLLKLPPPATTLPAFSSENGIPWTEDGVVIPHGSDARMEYLRGSQVYDGKFLNGKLVVGNRKFSTLSAASAALAVTRNGNKTNLNGWLYWSVKFPGENSWRKLGDLRKQS